MIIETIKATRLQARKDRNNAVASVLGVIIGELDRRQKHDDESCIKVISSAIDNNKLALEHAQGDQVDILTTENEVLESLLPDKLSESELDAFVSDFVLSTGASTMRDMGKLMGALKATGKVFDGGKASALFKLAIEV
ncbi:GatB/YqeY domain protein [Vibrio phage nt-1]|uniref:GatB/YqeY domain protein n=1 Tax=Vibrio phage nt-1 TaxID=115992 RepID=R9TF25_9CAUD|nr:tRNA amidotransferase [Vibrio phage nt-1]AGN30049.1 GatB/YqeY domain protein [Vibrio phage nt-1]